MQLRPHIEEKLRVIMDTFSGADGGVGFVRFRAWLEDADKQAAEGNKAAQELIQMVIHFARLIEASNGKFNAEKSK